MGEIWKTIARGWFIVFFVACNARLIAADYTPGVLATGFVISWVWWMNARTAAHSTLRPNVGAACYGLGAAGGSVTGMWVGALIGGW